tara:strand:- start:266 stop:406 length:141 start_codon:yes stop_codon:yes gene_type:complete
MKFSNFLKARKLAVILFLKRVFLENFHVLTVQATTVSVGMHLSNVF